MDPRQIGTALMLASQTSQSEGFQYIATLNSDTLESSDLRDHFNRAPYIVPSGLTDATAVAAFSASASINPAVQRKGIEHYLEAIYDRSNGPRLASTQACRSSPEITGADEKRDRKSLMLPVGNGDRRCYSDITKMPDFLACPGCKMVFEHSPELAGRSCRCSACQTIFLMPAIALATVIEEQPKPKEVLLSSLKQPTIERTKGSAPSQTKPICPYCDSPLKRMPGRQITCPNCGNAITVRSRPSDRQKIVIRDDQILEVEEQWSILNGTHAQFLAARKRTDDMRVHLRKKFDREPSVNDVRWGLLNDDVNDHMKQCQWGLYRNDRLAMAIF